MENAYFQDSNFESIRIHGRDYVVKINEMINCQGRRNDEGEFLTCNTREKVKTTTELRMLINIYLKVVFFRFSSQKNVKSFIYILK